MSWFALRAEVEAEFAAFTNHAEQLEQRMFREYQKRLAWKRRRDRELGAELKAKRAARPQWNPGRAPLNFACDCGERFGSLRGLNCHLTAKHNPRNYPKRAA